MNWQIFYGNGQQQKEIASRLKELKPPPWRQFGDEKDILDPERWEEVQELAQNETRQRRRGANFRIDPRASKVIEAVNAAIYLRRPLLVTGKPGSGKTSLAYAIAYELNLGSVLSWPINARSNLQDGLYRYDALARLQDTQQGEAKDIGEYITLNSLGTAFLPSELPRVLLIDEIDKSDINLPNDLLNIFEEGEFPIPELVRRSQEGETYEVRTKDKDIKATIKGGLVKCCAFPIVVMTSNGERDFPPAFKRRCLRIRMPDPNEETLQTIVKAHFGDATFQESEAKIKELIGEFVPPPGKPLDRAIDQLLNTVYLLTREVSPDEKQTEGIKEILLRHLSKE